MNERFLDKYFKPSDEAITEALGHRAPLWHETTDYIKANYNFTSEMVFFTKKYGWSVKYSKKQRSMCYLFPERYAFAVLIVLGKSEAERVESQLDALNPAARQAFTATEQLNDGRWIWLRILEPSDISSFKVLLAAKQKLK